MSEQVDLDALEERAKTRQAIDSPDVLALIAELRQERERARDAEERMRLLDQANDEEIGRTDKAEAALSRAEETIARALESANRYIEQPGYGDYYQGTEDAARGILAILTEYKQKEADRD